MFLFLFNIASELVVSPEELQQAIRITIDDQAINNIIFKLYRHNPDPETHRHNFLTALQETLGQAQDAIMSSWRARATHYNPIVRTPAELTEEHVKYLFHQTFQWKRNCDVEFESGVTFDQDIDPDGEWFPRSLITLTKCINLNRTTRIKKNFLLARLNIIVARGSQIISIPFDLGCFISAWGNLVGAAEYNQYHALLPRIWSVQDCWGNDYASYQQHWLRLLNNPLSSNHALDYMLSIIENNIGHMRNGTTNDRLSDSEHGLFSYIINKQIEEDIRPIIQEQIQTGDLFMGCILDVASLYNTCCYCDIFYHLMIASGSFNQLITKISEVVSEVRDARRAFKTRMIVRIKSPQIVDVQPYPKFLSSHIDVNSRFTLPDDESLPAYNTAINFLDTEGVAIIKKVW